MAISCRERREASQPEVELKLASIRWLRAFLTALEYAADRGSGERSHHGRGSQASKASMLGRIQRACGAILSMSTASKLAPSVGEWVRTGYDIARSHGCVTSRLLPGAGTG